MKKCPYCGAEYPDDVVMCAIDHTPLMSPNELPSLLEKSPTPNRFTRFVAVFSILTPLIAIFSYIILFEYLKFHGHRHFPLAFVISLFALLLTIVGFISGVIALVIAKQQGCKGILGKALIGICLNGLLFVLPIIFLLLAFMSGQKAPMTPQGRLDVAAKELSAASSDVDRFYALDDAAKESFNVGKIEDANNYARELLKIAPNFQRNWNYGNAIQDGNLVLGRIAARNGQIEEAKNYLLEAGKSPGSPQMDSFGPNMSLAKDLLEKGERDTVLQYFELCRKFWDDDFGKMDEWSQAVKAGKIPDFGANLVY
jgi:hypothetical protein